MVLVVLQAGIRMSFGQQSLCLELVSELFPMLMMMRRRSSSGEREKRGACLDQDCGVVRLP